MNTETHCYNGSISKMIMGKENKIALVIKTDGLEYDDRVRKEILSVQKLFPNISFTIFAMLPKNIVTEGITDYGIHYKTVYVPARDKYPASTKPMLKAYQFYTSLKQELKGFDAIWAANVDSSFFPLLTKNNKILWDLHELPTRFLGSIWKKLLLKYAFSRCKVVLHANPQRKRYLESIGVITEPSKHFALRNYPNFEDIDTEFDETYLRFVEWKKDKTCVYLQGLANDSRAAFESISAIMQINDLVAVVVGGFDIKSQERLKEKYGHEFLDRVFFTGKVPQLKIPQYVCLCQLSLIFYKNVRPNNWYCEANRFYQAVVMGLPVVVGNNPSMREIIDKYGFGVSVDDDGSSISKIQDGIKTVLKEYNTFLMKNRENRDKLIWSNQESQIKEIIELLFK